jgi:hypothetical protein
MVYNVANGYIMSIAVNVKGIGRRGRNRRGSHWVRL